MFLDSAVTLVLLVTLCFALAHAVPGGPAYAILGLKARPASLAALDMQLGVNVPLWRQYAIWWAHLAQGDFGTSFRLHQSVARVIAEYARASLAPDAAGLALALLLGMAGGIVHGAAPRSRAGRAVAAAELILYASPAFVTATLLVLVFAAMLHVLPAAGIADLHAAHPGLGDRMAHMALPVLCLGLLGAPAFSRVLAQALRRELGMLYADAARARGYSETTVILHHALPNALRPVVTLLGLAVPMIFAGSVAVESVFAYPGLGWLLWRSALSHDDPVLIAIVLIIGVATILGNLAADCVIAWLAPAGPGAA